MRHQINFKELRDAELAVSNDPKNVHDHLKSFSVPELQEMSLNDRQPWHVCCFNLTGDLNVGTIIRSAHLLGAKSVTIFGRTRIDNRGLVGASNYIKVNKVQALNDDLTFDKDIFIDTMNSMNLVPIMCELGGENIYTLPWEDKIANIIDNSKEPCLVMGNESNGIPDDIIRAAEGIGGFCVSIPQRGVIRSFNVSTAFSLIAGQMVSKMTWW